MNRKSKIVYSYNHLKEYTGTTLAYESWDFMDPPVWLIPSNSTESELPKFNEDNEIAVFNEQTSKWDIKIKPTPFNTIVPEYDPFLFEPQWNEKEKKWDLKKLEPSESTVPKPEYNTETHEVIWDRVKKEWKIIELPTPENTPKPKFDDLKIEENYTIIWNFEKRFWEFKRKNNWKYIREQRLSKIKETDWVMFDDVKIDNKEAWLEYRQALRDIPQKFFNPEDVIWPDPPQ